MLQTSSKIGLAVLVSIACLVCPPVIHAVEFANINIVDDPNDAINNPPTVTIPGGQGTSGFNIDSGSVTGLFPIRIGASATDDAANGVLIGAIRETGRTASVLGGGSETLYATNAISLGGSGELNLVTRRASADTANTLYPGGASFNANIAAGYFPFSEGWIGGTASASVGTVFDTFNLNGLTSGNISQNLFGTGDNFVSIPGVTDTRRQGILLASHASDSNLYTLATPTASGDGFNLTTKANNTNGSVGTDGGSLSFVFVPRNTPGMTMGRAHGGNSVHAASTAFQSGDAVTIVRETVGQYRLSIAGQTPSTGSLLVGTHGSNDGAGGRASDNVITYEASGNDWVILAQDLANLNGAGQDTNESEYYFDFAFLPFSGGSTGPGAIPAVSTLTNFSTSRVLAWNAEVTEINAANGPGSTVATVPQATSDVTVTPLGFNRGDNHYAIDGGFVALSEGVMLGSIREGLRDNSSTGGLTAYSVIGTNSRDGEWQVATATANAAPGVSTEFNINHALAFFGADTGFQMGVDTKVDLVTSLFNLTVSGVDPEANGVLLGTPASNDDNFLTVSPQGVGGGGWDVVLLDNSTLPEQVNDPNTSDGFNYVYLPYDAQNLIAGVALSSATLVSSTDPNSFSLTKVGTGEYKLTIPGKTPDTGMLLLNATAEGDGDNSVVYEDDPDGVSFRIIGIDHATVAEIEQQFILPTPEDTGFSFAYIDFEAPPMLQQLEDADFDGDGDVDGLDFLAWQRGVGNGTTLAEGDANGDMVVNGDDLAIWETQYGTVTPLVAAASAVPEPSSAVLLFAGILGLLRRVDKNAR